MFHQSAEAENCYGPFSDATFADGGPDVWAGPDRLLWEGFLDTRSILADKSIRRKDLVVRLDVYVGERDTFGIGFSDNVVFRKQYYVRALLKQPFKLYLHTDERFAAPGLTARGSEMERVAGGWRFPVKGTGFAGTFRIEIDAVPEDGHPVPFGAD